MPAPAATDPSLTDAQILGGAGTGAQAGGEIGAGVAALYAGKINQNIDEFNGRIAEYKAQAARNRGIFQANQIGRRGGQMVAAQTTAQAANGVVAGSGTGGTVEASTAATVQGDMATARNNALMEAWGFQGEAATDRLRGNLARSGGEQALEGSVAAAAGTAGGGFYRMSN